MVKSHIEPIVLRFRELPSEPLVIRACASTYVVFGLMFGVTLVAGLALTSKSPAGLLSVVALNLLALALSFAWIAAFKLVVANKFISYRTLFTGTRSLALSEIEGCDLALGFKRYWDRFKPPIRLVIQPQQSTGKKAISVNLKVLRRSDVLWLLKVLARQPEESQLPH
jgi:hypothetical protein